MSEQFLTEIIFACANRYETVRKENEALRAKLDAYTRHGSTERDGCWKRKYDAILREYTILRTQLEELGLPINDSIQKGLEELQVRVCYKAQGYNLQ